MPLSNCEINLILTLSANCNITDLTGVGKFAITVTLSTQDNAKVIGQLKSAIKGRTDLKIHT